MRFREKLAENAQRFTVFLCPRIVRVHFLQSKITTVSDGAFFYGAPPFCHGSHTQVWYYSKTKGLVP